MAECSYARCLQERRFIKRELLKWSKDMVQVIGLERFAEELMGRRKWKLFQEVLTRSQLNTNQNRTDQTNNFDPSEQTNIENLEPSIVENHHLTEKQEFTSTINKTEIKIDNLSLINDKTNNNKEIIEDNLINSNQTSPRTETKIGEKPIINPIDWKPSDKCYFCVDGKLLTVNEKGDLVAESGPALPEAELANRSTIDSDSDSRNSTPDTITNNHHTQLNTNKKLITSQTTRDSHPPNMTSFESMAAQIAAISKIQGLQSGLGQLYPSLWYHQLAQQLPMGTTTSESPSAAALSPSNKDSPSPSETTGEQPLDLSSKPSPVFRAKPRINTTVTGRRTYTEEELAMALQDILSGKLGTRRAAVIYGIPRSTLRNKVYKIALEQKREISSTSSHQPTLDALDVDDDDKDGSGDEDRDDKLLDSSLLAQQVDHLSRFETSHLTAAALQKLRKSNSVVNNEIDIVNKPSTSTDGQNKLLHSPSVNSTIPSAAVAVTTPTPSQQSQTPPIAPNRWLDTNVLLQSLLLSGSLGGLPGLLQQQQPKMDDPAALQELFNSLLMHQEEIMKEQLKNSTENRDALNNGKSSNLIDPLLLMQNLPLLRQQQQQQLNQLHTPRLPKSETPDTASSVDLNETISDDGVILKIPSFKPVVPGSSASSKNGDSAISPSSVTGHGLSSILSHSPHHTNNMSGIISPTLMRQSSESQSPPILSLREVIANSISRTFSQQQKESNMSSKSSYNSHESSSNNDQNKKRASISVIKTIGGTDISQFASTPNLLNNYHHHHHHHHQNSMNAGGAAGKGTRPKRGKYRNYDRDSLVEAVKAVQRGEMSVHRAGSYYGVPHSTLEYKVKERHLMRPRKREPKPQPLDERTGGNNNSSTNSNITSSATKHSNIPGLTNAVNNIDKLKTQSSGGIAGSLQQSKSLSSSSTGLKNSNNNNPPFPSTSPNGMKVPIFDSAMAAQLQYAPHLFWPHTAANFGGLPIDFQRQAAAAAAAANAAGTTGQPGGFTQQNAESFLASQMIQRFHEESNRLNAAAAATAVSQTGNNNNNYQKSTNISPSLIATTNSCTTNTTTNTTNLNNNINTNNIINNNNTTNINNSCSGGSSSSSSSSGSNSNVPIAKSAREIAESLYDNGGANGSFLDGIIRQTLDRKTGNDIKPSQGALLDQLVKNTNKTSSSPSGGTIPLISNINEHHNQNQHIHQSLTNNNNNNNSNNNNKRSGSPIQYPVIDIKRERSNSPLAQQQHHSHLSMALTPNDHHRNKRNSSIDGSKISDGDIESSEIDNDVTATSTTIKSNNDGSGSNSDGIMIKLEDNHQLHSLGRHHHHQLHQQLTSSNIRSIEDLNGGNSISGSSGSGGGGINNSILQEKLGHIKSETEDSL